MLVTVKLFLYMPQKQQTEASCQLHAPVDLPTVYTEQGASWAPRTVRN